MDNNFKLHSISHLIGNNPLLAIEFFFKGEKRIIYAKAENINMTGSIKDRFDYFKRLKELFREKF